MVRFLGRPSDLLVISLPPDLLVPFWWGHGSCQTFRASDGGAFKPQFRLLFALCHPIVDEDCSSCQLFRGDAVLWYHALGDLVAS